MSPHPNQDPQKYSHENRIPTLKKRREFLYLRAGHHWSAPTLVLQCRKRIAPLHDNEDACRVGYTVTKKTGNSVVRNRIKRRLREAAQVCFPVNARPGHDYAIIGKRRALNVRFGSIVQDLNTALDRVHLKQAKPAGSAIDKTSKSLMDKQD